MPELVSWGPFTIRTSLLAVIAAACAAIAAIRLLSRGHGTAGKETVELLQNAAFILLFVWKFGHVLFDPATIWSRPWALLVMNGGERELTLAVTAGILYIFVEVRHKQVPWRLFLDLVSFGTVVAVIVYAAIDWRYGKMTALPWGVAVNDPQFRYHPLFLYTMLVAAVVAYVLWLRRFSVGSGELLHAAAAYMGAGLLIVSYGDWPPERTFLLLSPFQWRAFVLMAFGIILTASMHNRGGKEWNESMTTTPNDEQNSLAQQRQKERNETKRRNVEAPADKKQVGPNRPSV